MKILICFLLAIFAGIAPTASAVGLLPVPQLKDVQIRAETRLDMANGWYVYAYTITNPPYSNGEIRSLEIDIRNPWGTYLSGYGLTIPMGGQRYDFQSEYDELRSTTLGKYMSALIPVGINVPQAWNGGLSITGVACMDVSSGGTAVKPGATLGDLELVSPGLPSIRDVWVIPKWIFMVEDHDTVTLADREAAGKVEQDIQYLTVALGPSGVDRGTFAHWNQLRDDLAKAVQLGWFPDAALAATLAAQLADARAALDARDFYQVHVRLAKLLATIAASTPAQRSAEGYALMYFNTKALDESTGNNDVEPDVRLSPHASGYSLGATHTATVEVVDRANGNRPMAGLRAYFYVDSGPHPGDVSATETDASGKASASYTGIREGIDSLRVRVDYCSECSKEAGETVSWVGGADLVVPLFTPPVLISGAGRQFFLNEITENIGTTASPPAVTRYYLFPNQNLDTNEAKLLGQRTVPALQPGESSRVTNQVFILPQGIPVGGHYLAACADVEQAVAELDESNNCSFNTLENRVNVPQIMESPNQPPDCSKATPGSPVLWPPNHKLTTVAIRGVSDPDNDPVSIKITAITQDEPVNGLGDGDTSPDGFGIGGNQAQLRAERSGTGNGRVYVIAFTADDGKGGTCSGNVKVGVPHDQGKGAIAIDDGQNYDSTMN